MHVLFLTQGFPNEYSSMNGIFFKDQAKSVAMFADKVGVIATTPISVKDIFKQRKLSFSKKVRQEEQLIIYSKNFPNKPLDPMYRIRKGKKIAQKLYEEYAEQHGVPDLIHVQRFEAAGLALHLNAKDNIPFVITEHSSLVLKAELPPKMESFARKVFTKASSRIGVSKRMSEALSKQYKETFDFLPNPVDTRVFTCRKQKEMVHTLISVGNLTENKNHRLLIDAFAELSSEYKELKLRIVGDGPERTALEGQINHLNLSDRITLTGLLDRTSLFEEYHNADVFCLTSKVETFGVVLIEAMSSGLPVIATDCGGPSSIITDAKVGMIVEQSVEELVNGLRLIIEQYSRYNNEEIHTFAQDNFSFEAVGKRIVDNYSSIVKH